MLEMSHQSARVGTRRLIRDLRDLVSRHLPQATLRALPVGSHIDRPESSPRR